MKKNHLCIDARLIHAAGIGRYLKELIKGFQTRGYKLTFLCHPKELNLFERGIPVKSPIYSMGEQMELPLKIPTCDLFFSPHFNIPLLPIRAKKRVTTLFDAYHLDHRSSLTFLQKIYASYFYKAATSRADHIITISTFSKERLLAHCHSISDNLTVIYPGIDKKRFETPSNGEVIDKVQKKYNLPNRFILFLGNFKPHKNLKRLLLAFKFYLSDEKDPLSLVLCGKKEGFIHGEDSLQKMIRENPSLEKKVVFTGEIEESELSTIYNLASLFVFPSLYEGFGYPPLEAMAASCPVIVSNAASIPEVCGDAPLYFSPYDIKGMSEAIKKVLTNKTLQQEMILKGKRRVDNFNLEKSLLAHFNLLEKVLS